MVKLLRFKYENSEIGTDVRGFGKQPITIGARSRIALKNYNIKLKTTLNNSIFIVTYTSDINFGLVEPGAIIQPINLPSGTYSVVSLLDVLNKLCNSIPGQNAIDNLRAFVTTVSLVSDNKLTFQTYLSPVTHVVELARAIVVEHSVPGAVIFTDGEYDCTEANEYSFSFINDSIDSALSSTVIVGGDCFSFTIVNVAHDTGAFGFGATAMDLDSSLWGIGYDHEDAPQGQYVYANNGEWNPINNDTLHPEDGDIMKYARSGLNMIINIIRGGVAVHQQTFNLDSDVLEPGLHNYPGGSTNSELRYMIFTTGPVIVNNLNFARSGLNEDTTLQVQCEDAALGRQLGFPGNAVFNGNTSSPSVYTLNPLEGGVDYKGIMVCINGLDLETYDFATTAEGKTNYLYTIQKSQSDLAADIAVSVAAGDIVNEPYIEMNNDTAINVNNKLSIYFLDTASGEKLQFIYADLLLIIREQAGAQY